MSMTPAIITPAETVNRNFLDRVSYDRLGHNHTALIGGLNVLDSSLLCEPVLVRPWRSIPGIFHARSDQTGFYFRRSKAQIHCN